MARFPTFLAALLERLGLNPGGSCEGGWDELPMSVHLLATVDAQLAIL